MNTQILAILAITLFCMNSLSIKAADAATVRAQVEAYEFEDMAEFDVPNSLFEAQAYISAGSGTLSEGLGESTAALGYLRANAFTHWTDSGIGPTTGQSTIQAWASWRDTLTINAPAMFGTAGSFTFLADLDGSLVVGGTSSDPHHFDVRTTVELNLSAGAGSSLNAQRLFHREAGGALSSIGTENFGAGVDLIERLVGTVNFVYGEPFILSIELYVSAYASADTDTSNPGDTGFAGANFNNTFEWGGIPQVFDFDGVLVENASVQGQVDWTQPIAAPVPLPGALWFFFPAIAGLASLGTKITQPGEIEAKT